MMFNKFSVSLCLILVCDFMDERKFVGGRWRARGQEGNGERHWGEAMTEATTRTNFLGV